MKDLQNQETNGTPAAIGLGSGLMDQITDYVQAHLTEKITLRELARRFDVSVSTITQTFRQKAGVTFHRYLTERRIEKATDLIREGTPLKEAGRMVGYTDHSCFYRAFRQSQGLSPREYRRSVTQK